MIPNCVIMSAIDLSGKYNNRILPFYYRLPDYDRLLVKCGFNIKEIILNTELRFNKNLVICLPIIHVIKEKYGLMIKNVYMTQKDLK